jgi:hypothetical protein
MLHKNVNVTVRARHSQGKKRYFIPVHAQGIQGKKKFHYSSPRHYTQVSSRPGLLYTHDYLSVRFGEAKNLLSLPVFEPPSLVDTHTVHVKYSKYNRSIVSVSSGNAGCSTSRNMPPVCVQPIGQYYYG